VIIPNPRSDLLLEIVDHGLHKPFDVAVNLALALCDDGCSGVISRRELG
jgi:hypothetical protein